MDWKAFWKKFVFPPVWLMAILLIVSAVGLPVVVVKCMIETPVA